MVDGLKRDMDATDSLADDVEPSRVNYNGQVEPHNRALETAQQLSRCRTIWRTRITLRSAPPGSSSLSVRRIRAPFTGNCPSRYACVARAITAPTTVAASAIKAT